MGTGRGPTTRSRSSRAAGARAVALRVIRRVTEDAAYSNLTLAGELDGSTLDGRDRRFAADLAYGTLRRLRSLDAAIVAAAERPIERIDAETLAILRLGAFQIGSTRVPPHAAVSESVALAPARSRGFANAVLRRIAADPQLATPPAGDSGEDIAARTGLSGWAIAELRRVLPASEVEPAAAALAEPAPLCLRVDRARTTPEGLSEALRDAGLTPEPGRHHPDVLLVASATPAALPGYREGWFVVQDEASVLVAEAVGTLPGERILDACAAPGGKASFLAARAGPSGIVVAADLNRTRAGLVRTAAVRLGLSIPILTQDASRPALREGAFDAVLVDAPCSGIGAARRRPELLWRVPRERLSSLARVQLSIMTGVADLVGVGGRVVYSVCTFPAAETEGVARAFLAARPDFAPADVPGPDGPAPTQRLWPDRHGTDGMFYAGFRRVADARL